MNVKIHQGETKIFDLLAVEDDLNFEVTRLEEVNLPTHTHEIELSKNCGVFELGGNIYVDFHGVNSCFSGCYEITFLDDCGTIVGFNAEDCLANQNGTEFITTCCGGVITKTNKIATAYKPLNLKACDSIISHVRVISSHLIRKPAFVGSYQCDSNAFFTTAKNAPDIKVGATVVIDGNKYTICSVENRSKKTIAVILDREFMASNNSARMVYSSEPIAVLTGGVNGPVFCSTCGTVTLSLSSEDSYKLIPGVIYHWDVISRSSEGTRRLGGGTLELEETYTYGAPWTV